MKGPAFINVVIPFDPVKAGSVETAIKLLSDPERGNYPAQPVAKALSKVRGLHFMTLSVARPLCPAEANAEPPTAPPSGKCAHLLVEITSDYGPKVLFPALVEHFEKELSQLFKVAGHPVPPGKLLAFLHAYEIQIRAGWSFRALGQVFSGTPRLSVERIKAESELVEALLEIINQKSLEPEWQQLSPRLQLERVRNALWVDKVRPWKWAFAAAPALPIEANETVVSPLTNPGARKAVCQIVFRMLWPVFTVLTLIVVVALIYFCRVTEHWFVGVACTLTAAGFLALGFFILLFGVLKRLNHLANTDFVDERIVSLTQADQLFAVENIGQQNHLLSSSRLKSGFIRWLTLRLAFIAVGAAGYVNVPGFLGKNGVIHSARWMRLPGTNQLVFWSNYDGTWESYVADFISDAPEGVTGIWSNCIGFPRTHGLFSDGATDEDRTVRWARRQQIPTPFWYKAYENLSAARIRTNSQIRQGLATAESYQDCVDWFSLFGSSLEPANSLQTSQITTIAFGGLSRMRFASCFIVSLSQRPVECRAFLAALREHTVFGSAHKDLKVALVIGVSADGLRRLGLPREAVETFPVAFKQGMYTQDRSRELGDTGENAPGKWTWGGGAKGNADVIVLVYAQKAYQFKSIEDTVRNAIDAAHTYIYQPLTTLNSRSDDEAQGPGSNAPFGFMDGISQPIMRGAPMRNRARDENDLVAPGEFILGYPDNVGSIPPGPYLEARHDPDYMLPDAGVDPTRTRPSFASYEPRGRRDLGMNGTFLVVRQYKQHIDAFDDWFTEKGFQVVSANVHDAKQMALKCEQEGRPHFPFSAAIPTFSHFTDEQELRELLFAKLFGRWRDGASLVRHGRPPQAVEGQKPRTPDNDFMCGQEDPAGHGCPFGAHVRRANPRDSRFPGSKTEIAAVNRHRMLRVSRVYDKIVELEKKNQFKVSNQPGVLFMCVNGDIERQFEFVQKTWLLNPSRQGDEIEVDPIVGRGEKRCFTIPTPNGPVRLSDLPDLTTLIGGGYFFIPSKALLGYLARPEKCHAHPAASPIVATNRA